MSEANKYLTIERDDSATAIQLTVGEAPPEGKPVRSRIFGNFLEHLGYAIQGGISAQLLNNPAFFANGRWPNQNLPAGDLALLRENGAFAERLHRLTPGAQQAFAGWRPHERVTGFGLMVLDDESAYGIPIPWKVSPHGSGMGGQVGRVGSSLRISPAAGEAVLSQGVFPQHGRERTYVGHLWVRATGEGTLGVAFRRRGPAPDTLVEAGLAWPGTRYQKIEFSLTLPEGALVALEPVDFCIVVNGSGQVWVDRAILMPADHIEGLDPVVVAQIKQLAPPTLRWPGGNFTSTYHFWEGIGPLDERQTFVNTDWHGIEDNLFGINEFLRLCQIVDTEPHLCVNIGSGTAEEAANWVEYVNGDVSTHWGALRAAHGHPEPWDVRLWEVGNEIYGPWQTGHCGPEENARRYRVWAQAMLDVDPTLELIATGCHTDFVDPNYYWHEALFEDGGPTLLSIALHALPGNSKGIESHPDAVAMWHELMAHPHRWERVDLPGLLAQAKRHYPDRTIDYAITEWGILGDTQRPQVGNLGGAIYAALFLGMSIRVHEHLRVANATALMHGGAIRKAGPFHYADPQVEVIRRYTTLSGGDILPITYRGAAYDIVHGGIDVPEASDVPWVDAVAVRQGDQLTVALCNRSAHETSPIAIQLPAGMTVVPASWEIMTGHMRAMNTPVNPEHVRFEEQPLPAAGTSLTLTLPARAIGWLQGTISTS